MYEVNSYPGELLDLAFVARVVVVWFVSSGFLRVRLRDAERIGESHCSGLYRSWIPTGLLRALKVKVDHGICSIRLHI